MQPTGTARLALHLAAVAPAGITRAGSACPTRYEP
jgi:hypothetical protein